MRKKLTVEEQEYVIQNSQPNNWKTAMELSKTIEGCYGAINILRRNFNLRFSNIEKICPICKQKFKMEHARQKFCSRFCYEQERRVNDATRHPKITKKCPECQNTFETKYRRKVYCSPECLRKYQNRVRHTPLPTSKECVFCGQEFHPRSNVQRFCSYVCNYRFGDARHPRHPKIPKIKKQCPNCGKEFLPSCRNSQIYCSSECAIKYANRMRKERLKKVILKCPECRKEFTPATLNVAYRFCCRKCQTKHHNKLRRKPFKCIGCGKKFFRKRSSQRYCTYECRELFDPRIWLRTNYPEISREYEGMRKKEYEKRPETIEHRRKYRLEHRNQKA